MMSDEELDRLQALADAATRGPWTAETWDNYDRNRSYGGGPRVTVPSGNDVGSIILMNGSEPSTTGDDRNAAFVAASREAVPALIAELRELRMVVHDLLQDGFQKNHASKYRRVLESLRDPESLGSGIGWGQTENGILSRVRGIVEEALREGDA